MRPPAVPAPLPIPAAIMVSSTTSPAPTRQPMSHTSGQGACATRPVGPPAEATFLSFPLVERSPGGKSPEALGRPEGTGPLGHGWRSDIF